MAMNGESPDYRRLFGHQHASDVAVKERLDTNGEPLQPNNRYWVVGGGDDEIFIYNSLIDVDNYLENFGDSGHDNYCSAILSLYSYLPKVRMVRYLGHDRFEEEK